MSKKCKTCGGTKREDGGCNICELLGQGPTALAVVGGTATSGWPLMVEGLSVHPKQAAQANARAKRHGINVQYDQKGDCYVPDRGNYAKILKLEGYHNKSSFGRC